jgi:hypothetical protein
MTRTTIIFGAVFCVACGSRSDLTVIVDDATIADANREAEVEGDGANCSSLEGPIDSCEGGVDGGSVIRCRNAEQCLYNVGGTAIWACCLSSDSADSGCVYAAPNPGYGCPY